MGQALPAIDTELPVFDGMRLERFPVDGSSRAVLLARIAPDALFLIDLNKGQAVRLYPCFGHIEFVFDMFHNDTCHSTLLSLIRLQKPAPSPARHDDILPVPHGVWGMECWLSIGYRNPPDARRR